MSDFVCKGRLTSYWGRIWELLPITGSNIFILLRFSVLGLIYYLGKNYFLTGYYLVEGLFCVPFITGVPGPFESDELGRVLSSLLFYNDFFSLIAANLALRAELLENKLMRLIL